MSRHATVETARMARRVLQQLGRPQRTMWLSVTPDHGVMDLAGFTADELMVRDGVGRICAQFPNSYWRARDAEAQDPWEFHAALGGVGLGVAEATMMQTIAESGAGMAGAQAVHANVYATLPLARFGSPELLRVMMPKVMTGAWRVCFGMTEPNAGLDTQRLTTTATWLGGNRGYSISGQKIWITCAQVASKMLLLARTTQERDQEDRQKAEEEGRGKEGEDREEAKRGKSNDKEKQTKDGLSSASMSTTASPGLTMRPIAKMGGRAVAACERAVLAHGGMGYAVEYDVSSASSERV